MSSFNVAQRIAPTAKLGIKGSLKQKGESAAALNRRFFDMAMDIEQRSDLTTEELSQSLQELCPGVKLEVRKNDEMFDLGSVEYLLDSASRIEGFRLVLPFVQRRGKQVMDNIESLFHETRHFFDAITDSVGLARHNSRDIPNSRKYDDFYSTKLYAYELSPEEEHLVSGDEQSYKAKRKALNKRNIKQFLDTSGLTAKEKIDVLRDWKNSLKSEENAFADGINYRWLSYVNKPSRQAAMKIDSINNKKYFFQGKIEVVEDLIAEELVKARNVHIDNLKSQGKLSPEHGYHSVKTA